MHRPTDSKTRTWMWCLGLVLLYLASYAPADVWLRHRGFGAMNAGLVAPDPFAPPPPTPRWMTILYGPARGLYNWKPLRAPMDLYYHWWEGTL